VEKDKKEGKEEDKEVEMTTMNAELGVFVRE